MRIVCSDGAVFRMDRGHTAGLQALPDDDVPLGCLWKGFEKILALGDSAGSAALS